MQTKLIASLRDSSEGQEAESILRSCVHCGFCNATCPTYQVLGEELDGPRGRIYLIKKMLEGEVVSEHTRQHLDRCLSCRACETTCPSGVRYHRLLDIGKAFLERTRTRPLGARLQRVGLVWFFRQRRLFSVLMCMAARVRGTLPRRLRAHIPPRREQLLPRWDLPVADKAVSRGAQPRVLVLQGCVQDALAPDINRATHQLFDLFGWQVASLREVSCCGALPYHLDQQEQGLAQVKANIDAWWPHIEQGNIEAIVVNASGCGAYVKDYGDLLRNDAVYCDKAARVAGLARDPIELMLQQDWSARLAELGLSLPLSREKLVFHPPCSLQHGQQIKGAVEGLLQQLGAQLQPLRDAHLCCGSAGTYSLTQPAMAQQLRAAKLNNLEASQASRVLTANIGCQAHLSARSRQPVMHWLEWVAEVLTAARSAAPKA